ncbi:MAG: phosphoribosyl-AMP cyclohydrolase [Candidatus Brocadiia bacterium]
MDELLEALTFQDGLVPAVITDEHGTVLVLCYMDREALRKTLETGRIHVFRRSRGRVMLKGETSGHTQHVKEVRVDCEGNSLLFVVQQKVAACHAGYYSCYYRRYDAEQNVLEVAEERVFDPAAVYGQ